MTTTSLTRWSPFQRHQVSLLSLPSHTSSAATRSWILDLLIDLAPHVDPPQPRLLQGFTRDGPSCILKQGIRRKCRQRELCSTKLLLRVKTGRMNEWCATAQVNMSLLLTV